MNPAASILVKCREKARGKDAPIYYLTVGVGGINVDKSPDVALLFADRCSARRMIDFLEKEYPLDTFEVEERIFCSESESNP